MFIIRLHDRKFQPPIITYPPFITFVHLISLLLCRVGDEEHHETDLLEKIEVLSRTLASVNEAKAKMEATFLADKKTMLVRL